MMSFDGKVAYADWSSYLSDALFNIDRIISNAEDRLYDVEFDTMIGTGLSGALVIPSLARAMEKSFAIVRKPNDSQHAQSSIEGKIGKRWIFVDDLVDSGSTKKRVIDTVSKTQCRIYNRHNRLNESIPLGDLTTYVGCYMYQGGGYFQYSPLPDLEIEF
jgi:orotate phosphoribosyltransferase-like protein